MDSTISGNEACIIRGRRIVAAKLWADPERQSSFIFKVLRLVCHSLANNECQANVETWSQAGLATISLN